MLGVRIASTSSSEKSESLENSDIASNRSNVKLLSGSVGTMVAPAITPTWSDLMESINPEAMRATLRNMWRWWETYIFFGGLLFFIAFAVHGSVKDAATKMLRQELAVIKQQYKEDLETVKVQNERSIEDRAFLHMELKNTRDSLKRLEKKVQSDQ